MNKISFTIYLLMLVMLQNLYAQTTTVTFVNTGAMNVSSGGVNGVALYVPDAMRQLSVSGRDVEIVHNGITELGGNFYHDAISNVFKVDVNSTVTTSTGKFRFVKDRGINRTIATQSVGINTFDRGLYYIAFPNIEIETNDSIIIPGKMGIDATTLKRVSSKTGQMVLRSDVITDAKGTNAYDASLRITGAGLSAGIVDLGAVVVERDMSIYRPDVSTSQLFGFATPFKNTQLSGYFAGNWLRRPLHNGTFDHTTYVYGNKNTDPADGVIDVDQYVYRAAETLVPAQAYLIKPRPKGFDYSTLQASNGLWYTGEANPSLYDKGKFYFAGKVYTVTPYREQLFADDILYSNTINTSGSNLANTVNLLIGNSYTCPIPTKLLAQNMENLGLTFSPYIYVYPAGATTYLPLSISGTGNSIVVSDVSEIPAMSIFMVRLAKNNVQNGTFTIGKSMQRHADVAHNNPQPVKAAETVSKTNSSKITNQVILRVSPVGNDNIYDVAAIGLREDASQGSDDYDMAKAYINDNNIFQLYTLSSTGSKLTSNGLPLTTDTVKLVFEPSVAGGEYKLTAAYAETLETDGLWIYDKKLDKWTDIKADGSFTFSTTATDASDRFYLLFNSPDIHKDQDSNSLHLYYGDNNLIVRQLSKSDIGSTITLYDPRGRQMHATQVTTYPNMNIPVQYLLPGVYLVHLKGEKTGIAKFIKQ